MGADRGGMERGLQMAAPLPRRGQDPAVPHRPGDLGWLPHRPAWAGADDAKEQRGTSQMTSTFPLPLLPRGSPLATVANTDPGQETQEWPLPAAEMARRSLMRCSRGGSMSQSHSAHQTPGCGRGGGRAKHGLEPALAVGRRARPLEQRGQPQCRAGSESTAPKTRS